MLNRKEDIDNKLLQITYHIYLLIDAINQSSFASDNRNYCTEKNKKKMRRKQDKLVADNLTTKSLHFKSTYLHFNKY